MSIYVVPGASPRANPPSREIYALMGEENIFQMLEHFYLELEQSAIREMFPSDMVRASQKSALFFIGVLGGPPLYQMTYGSPMMRARHMPFAITEAARDVWLACFEKVLQEAPARYNFPPQHLEGFYNFLRDFSLWMVNTSPA